MALENQNEEQDLFEEQLVEGRPLRVAIVPWGDGSLRYTIYTEQIEHIFEFPDQVIASEVVVPFELACFDLPEVEQRLWDLGFRRVSEVMELINSRLTQKSVE